MNVFGQIQKNMEELQMNGSMIRTAKDLDHTELRKLMMVMMMAMTIKMNRSVRVKKREGDSVSTVTYQTRSPGGGVADGEVTSSPGCSGMRVSAGEPGPCMPGGVEEALRASVAEPLRDTQEVSITRTPILETNTYPESCMMMKKEARGGGKERSGEKGMIRYLCIFLMLR